MSEREILLEIRDRITKMERYLYNDEATGKDGIVKAHEKLNSRVSQLEEQEKIRKTKATTWGVIGGVIISAIYKLVEFFLK
mgnify:FL=1